MSTREACRSPYLHSLACHLGDMVVRWGPWKQFTSQACESLHQWIKTFATKFSNKEEWVLAVKACLRFQVIAATVTLDFRIEGRGSVLLVQTCQAGRTLLAGGRSPAAATHPCKRMPITSDRKKCTTTETYVYVCLVISKRIRKSATHESCCKKN